MRATYCRRLQSAVLNCLLPQAVAGALVAVTVSPAMAQSTATIGSTTLVNQGLVGVGRIPASMRDFFGETFGLVSGLSVDLSTWRRVGDSYTGSFLTLPDRGYNVAGTTNYIDRVQNLKINFTPYYGTTPLQASQQNQFQANLVGTTLLTEANGNPTTGLDALPQPGARPPQNGFPVLPQAGNGRISLDPEAIVRNRDGTFWISDEYGPYIYRFDATGKLLSTIRPPDAFIPIRNGVNDFSANAPGFGQTAPTPGDPVTGRQNNQGLEGLALTPNGKTLVAALQSATRQDGGNGAATDTRKNTRMLFYDVSNPSVPRLTQEYVVQLPTYIQGGTPRVAAQSELLALNNTQFLMLSRDSGNGQGLATATSLYRSIDFIDIAGATNIAGSAFDGTTPIAPNGVRVASVTPVNYTSFININQDSQLSKFGLRNGTPNDRNNLSEKWEAMGLLPVLDRAKPNDFFLIVGNDNDFITQNGFQVGKAYTDPSGADIDSMFLVYRLTLLTYVDPLAVLSLERTALPLAFGLGQTALNVVRTATRDIGGRLFVLRSEAGLSPVSVAAAELTSLPPSSGIPGLNVYATGNFGFGTVGPDGVVPNTGPDTKVGTAGADYRLMPGLSVGFAGSYLSDNTSYGNIGNSALDGYLLTPYVSAVYGNFYVDGSYSYGHMNWGTINRNTGAYGLTATGTTTGNSHTVQLNTGYNLAQGQMVLGPLASLYYTRAQIDAYTETNAIHLNAAMPSQNLDSLVATFGGQASYTFRDGPFQITPQLRIGVDVGVLDNDRNLTFSLANRPGNPAATFTGLARTVGDTAFHGGAGVMVRYQNAALVLDYDVRTNGNRTDHLFGTSLRISF